MYFDHQEAANYEWSQAQNAAFNRCVDFLVKMVEKYGNAIPLDKHTDNADRTRRDPCSDPGAGTYSLLKSFSFLFHWKAGLIQ